MTGLIALVPLDSPFSPPGTSISLLSSLYNCESLWVFLAPESHFTINLGVLPSVLYEGKTLDVTVRGGPTPRGRRLNSRTLDHHRTTDTREH